jgi:thioredoxin reductase (NADPH)
VTAGDPTVFSAALTVEQFAALALRGSRVEVVTGEILYSAGDRDFDFVVVESGEVDVVRPEMPGSPEALITTWGALQFLGELNLVTGQTAVATARVRTSGAVLRIPPDHFRALMAEDAELSDLILRALLDRRQEMRTGVGALALEILGSGLSAATHELRTWAARQQLPYTWVDFDAPAGQALARAAAVEALELPAVVTATGVIRNATAAVVSDHLGLTLRSDRSHDYDLAVIGGGPAGLAAAVYGASEGLSTILLDSVAVGGQAAASSRIENYLGFPSGISGIDLTSRALVQANKFGAQISSPCRVVSLDCGGGLLQVRLSNEDVVNARSVIIATGAQYRTLPLEGWSEFEGAGIYYAATDIEARACAFQPVTVVGGANSAGQASLFLADSGNPVHLVVRGADLEAGMSRYLVDRVLVHPRIDVHVDTEVTKLDGEAHLASIRLTTGTAEPVTVACSGLFCFIGASPATGWLGGVALDEDGFVLTDRDVPAEALTGAWELLGRTPLALETSVPGIFAAGDVRSGSMKRVAAAVGEGASAVRSVHLALAAVS